ncbi:MULTISPECIES: hypothetical protein [unclassified Chryseobacterium]|uniref:tetratricopeptide repeat protein n=1 Tax=unclassified Chryseobacterium TaxID=2593645 RepID=UPI00226A8257|nr:MULTISPECIES: hypothetical protein [unclassified Chryseobacterium]
MKIQSTLLILFLGIICYSQNKIIGYLDNDANKDYIVYDTKSNNKIYLYKNGKFKFTKDIPSFDSFFDDYDEDTSTFFINTNNKKGEIILGAERGASLKVSTTLFFKYISSVNSWLLYKEENSEVQFENRMPTITIKYHPYSLGIDGQKYPANKKMYLEDSLQNRKISNQIFNDEYEKLKSSKNLKKYNFNFSLEDLNLLLKNIPLTENNVNKYNDFAFYIAQNDKENFKAIYIYNEIIKKFPKRVVTYLNLADSYWLIDNKDLAEKNYKKYIELMKSQSKDQSKIPQRVFERIK